MHITLDGYAAVCGIDPSTAGRRLAHAPFRQPKRSHGRKFFALAAALLTLTPHEIAEGAIPAMVRASERLSKDEYLEPEALPMARDFASWLPDPAMQTRARGGQNAFVVAVANSKLCTPAIVENLEALRDLFVLNQQVTRWILLGGGPPDVDKLAPAFAVANNDSRLAMYTPELKEAA